MNGYDNMMTMSDRQFFTGGHSYTAPYQDTSFSSGVGQGSNPVQNVGVPDPTQSTGTNWFTSVGPNGAVNPGVINQAVGIGSALAQSWLGFQQLGLAKDAFNFQQDAFNKQFTLSKDAYDTAKANQEATAASQNA